MAIMRGKNKHILTNVVIVVIYSNLLLFCRKRKIVTVFIALYWVCLKVWLWVDREQAYI